jgi:hypothetical protein
MSSCSSGATTICSRRSWQGDCPVRGNEKRDHRFAEVTNPRAASTSKLRHTLVRKLHHQSATHEHGEDQDIDGLTGSWEERTMPRQQGPSLGVGLTERATDPARPPSAPPKGNGDASSPESEARAAAAPVHDIEVAASRLLRAYVDALRFGAGLPLLGVCRGLGEDGEARARWVSRPFTVLYLHSHVRKQLRRAARAVDLELLPRDDAEERKRLSLLSDRLKRPDEGVFGWGRLREIAARLPPVTAAIPIVAGAVTAFLQGQAVDARGVLRAVALLSTTGFLVWLLFVWPSIRLGFRVKRAILAGGKDLSHPLWNNPGELRWQFRRSARLYEDAELVRWPDQLSYLPDRPWKGLFAAFNPRSRSRAVHASEGWTPFPTENVYQLEEDLFRLVHDGGARELPVDMLFSAAPYVLLSVVVFFFVGVADAVGSDRWGDVWWAIPLTLVLTALFFRVILQATRNHRARSGGGPVDWVDLIPRAYRRGRHREFVGWALSRAGASKESAVLEQIARAAEQHPEEFPPDLMKDLPFLRDGERVSG